MFLSYLSKLKIPINTKLHVLLIFCFLIIPQFFRYLFPAISHRGPHKKLSVKVGRKLEKVRKPWNIGLLH